MQLYPPILRAAFLSCFFCLPWLQFFLRGKTLFADDMILYRENPKDTIRKLLELIGEYSEVPGYKTSTQKSFAFLDTNNEKSEREIKEINSLTTATTKKRYLGEELDYKAERQRIDASELWCFEDSCESLGLQGDPTSQS